MREVELREEMDAILESDDALHLIVRGHAILDELFSILLDDSLPTEHSKELGRLSLLLKVDLAIALALIPRDARGAFKRFNSIRNDLAHGPTHTLSEKESRDLYNALSPDLQAVIGKDYDEFESPIDAAAWILAAHFVALEKKISDVRDSQLEMRLLHKEVEKLRDGRRAISEGETTRRVRKRVEVARKKRKDEGRF